MNPKTKGIIRWMAKRCCLLFTISLVFFFAYTIINIDTDALIESIFFDEDYAYSDSGAAAANGSRPKKSKKKSSKSSINENIELAVVGCKGPHKDSVGESLNMIKSAILFTNSKLHVNIFTDAGNDFEEALSAWPKEYLTKFSYSINDINYPLTDEEIEEYRNWWGPCASFRLFLPQVMKKKDSVIYVDSDVLFLSNVNELWSEFKNFNENQVGALAPRAGWHFKVPSMNQNYIMTPNGRVTQVNSGVFLMNLTRMRKPVFRTNDKISLDDMKWDKDLFFPLYHKYKSDMYGDQNLINIIFHFNPHLIYLIECRYNYHHKFCFDKEPDRWCKSAEMNGAAIIHGSAKTFYNNYSPAFRAINDAFKEFKFGEDLEEDLLRVIRRNLMDPLIDNHEHCGGKAQLFLKNLEESVREAVKWTEAEG